MCDANQPVPDRVACGLRNGKESVSEVDPPHDRCLPMAATLAEGSSWILFAPELYTFLEIEKEVCVRAAQRTTDRSHLRPLSSCPEGGTPCQGCSRTESRTQWTQPSSIWPTVPGLRCTLRIIEFWYKIASCIVYCAWKERRIGERLTCSVSRCIKRVAAYVACGW